MGTGIGRRGIGRVAAAAAALTLAACQSAPGRIPAAAGIIVANPVTAEQLGAPRVHIQTEYESFGVRRVRTRVRLEEDAYVLVVNVAPDGMAQVVFPETPRDAGLLRGGQSYLLPTFFSGYPSVALETQSTMTRFVQVSRSIYASSMIRGPGYIFALASRTPFDMQRLEDEGFFDWVDFGNQLYELDPEHVIPAVAEVALWDVPNFIATTDVARYAGYDPSAGQRASLAYASGRSSVGCPNPLLMTSGFFETYYSPFALGYADACLMRDPMLRRLLFGRTVPTARDTTGQPQFPRDSTQPDGPVWRRQQIDTTRNDAGPVWRRHAGQTQTRAIDPVVEAAVETGRVRPFAPGRLREDEIELTRETRERMLRRQRFQESARPAGRDGTPARARPREGSRPTYEPGRVSRRQTSEGTSPRDSRATRSQPARTESRPTRTEPSASPRASSGGSSSGEARSSGSSGSSGNGGSSGNAGASSSGKRQVSPD